MEATYFNQSLSLWEPLIETLEKQDGRHGQWDMQIKVIPIATIQAMEKCVYWIFNYYGYVVSSFIVLFLFFSI